MADLYKETCAKYGKKPGRRCAAISRISPTTRRPKTHSARAIRYYKKCVIPSFPGDEYRAADLRCFVDIVEKLHKVRPEDLTENPVLLCNLRASPSTSRRSRPPESKK